MIHYWFQDMFSTGSECNKYEATVKENISKQDVYCLLSIQ